MDIVKTISEKIYELRKARGITQDALAAELGVTYQAVSKWENALACPDISLLPKIAEYFGIKISELFGEESTKPENNPADIFRADNGMEDDNTLYAVLFRGKTLIKSERLSPEEKELAKKVVLSYTGDIQDIIACNISVEISGNANGDIVGNGCYVKIGGDMHGDVVGNACNVTVYRNEACGTDSGDEKDGEAKSHAKKTINDIVGDIMESVSDMTNNIKIVVDEANRGVKVDSISDESEDDDEFDDLAERTEELQDLLYELQDLKDELDDLRDELDDLEDESEELRDELSDLADELSNAETDSERENIIDEMNSKKSEIANINSEIEDKKADIDSKRQEIAEKKDAVAIKKEELRK